VPNYHAYSSDTRLVAEAVLVITGGREAVDLQVSDRLTIECPGEYRIDALVLERGGGTMVLAIADGGAVALRIATAEHFEQLTLDSGFSRQCWVVI